MPDIIETLKSAISTLEEVTYALDEIAERTWDKRHPDECRLACSDASDMAGGKRDEIESKLVKYRSALADVGNLVPKPVSRSHAEAMLATAKKYLLDTMPERHAR